MASLSESAVWEPNIYQLETTDPVMGGAAGVDNLQSKQLANRTTYLKTELLAAVASSPPIGSVSYFAGSTPPERWLECDGAAVSRVTYAALFAVISTTFGVGDGSTTFNLPDLRGEFVRGWDHSRGIDSDRALGDPQDEALQAHNHYLPTSTATNGTDYGINDANAANPAWSQCVVNYSPVVNATAVTYPRATYNNGTAVGEVGDFDVETRPRNIALMGIIKAL